MSRRETSRSSPSCHDAIGMLAAASLVIMALGFVAGFTPWRIELGWLFPVGILCWAACGQLARGQDEAASPPRD